MRNVASLLKTVNVTIVLVTRFILGSLYRLNVNTTDALNLWDIELRIKDIHDELNVLHEAKEELLSDRKGHKRKWESTLPEHYYCE